MSRRPVLPVGRLLLVSALVGALASCTAHDELRAESAPVLTTPDPTRTAQCIDGERTWSADLVDGPGTVSVVRLAGPDAGPWLLVGNRVITRERIERPLTPAELPIAADPAESPRLVSPDRRCTLYLVPTSAAGPRSVVIVGDSLAALLVATSDARVALQADARTRGVRVLVDGQSGAPWMPLDDEGANLEDELRGARSVGGDVVLATVIGANDAILAALATGGDKQTQRDRSDEVIAATITAVREQDRCIVVTTPPDVAISTFGLGDAYASEAARIGAHLRTIAPDDPRVVVADFASASRAHHLVDGATGDWFSGDDELHPNPEGTAALRTLLLDAAQRCPAG